MDNIYCGNNALHPDLLNGTKRMGTRYECMRKGVGTGLNLPYDEEFNNDYEPIDDRKIFCGDRNILPEGYDRFGNAPQCLQKGVGIGKKIKVQRGIRNLPSSNNKIMLFLILSILMFIIFYNSSLFRYTNEEGEIIIEWNKLLLYYVFLLIIFYLIFFNYP
jgi:hypothetical protein